MSELIIEPSGNAILICHIAKTIRYFKNTLIPNYLFHQVDYWLETKDNIIENIGYTLAMTGYNEIKGE